MKLYTLFAVSLCWVKAQATNNSSSLSFDSFDLIKNTGFYLPRDDADLEYKPATTGSKPPPTESYYRATNRKNFCRKFHADLQPYPVATTHTRAAFLPGWPASLLGGVSLCTSFLLLFSSIKPDKDVPFPTLFWTMATVDVARVVVWWINVIKGAQDLRTAGYPSVILWTVVVTYAALGDAICQRYSIKFRWWIWFLKAYAFAQWGLSLAILVVRWTLRYTSMQSHIPLRYDEQSVLFPGSCADQPLEELPQDFFTDPTVEWYRIVQTVQFVICSCVFVFVLVVMEGMNVLGVHRESPVGKTPWLQMKIALLCTIMVGYFILLLFQLSTMSLRGAPFRLQYGVMNWQLVVIMMDPNYGFWDMHYDRAWRIIGSFLAVY